MPKNKQDFSVSQNEGKEISNDFSNALSATPYKYKEGLGEDTNKLRVGPSAEQMEQLPNGEDLVDDSGEIKTVNIDRLALTTQGITAELGKRVQELERIIYGEK